MVQGPVTPLTGWRFPRFPAGKNMVPLRLVRWIGEVATAEIFGPRWEAVFQIARLLRDWAAKRAVVPPACLGLWTSEVGWPGMQSIWRRASVIPQGQERHVKPGPPSIPCPRRRPAFPTAWPSPADRHLGPLTGGFPHDGLPGSMGVPTGHHGP